MYYCVVIAAVLVRKETIGKINNWSTPEGRIKVTRHMLQNKMK